MNNAHETVQIPARVWLSIFHSPALLIATVEHVAAEPDVGHPAAGYIIHAVYLKLTPPMIIVLGHAVEVEGYLQVAIQRNVATIALDLDKLAVLNGRMRLESSTLDAEIEAWLIAAAAGEGC